MKQHITTEQLNELSEEGKEDLREWWHKRPLSDNHGLYIPTPLLSIGQSVEYLKERSNDFVIEYEDSNDSWRIYHDNKKEQYKSENPFGDAQLIDALWSAVKQVLDSKDQV